MEELFKVAEKVVYGFISFGDKFMQIIESPFIYLPAYIGINSESPLANIWAVFMQLIGFISDEGLNETPTIEVIIGPLLTTIIIIGVIKYFKDLI